MHQSITSFLQIWAMLLIDTRALGYLISIIPITLCYSRCACRTTIYRLIFRPDFLVGHHLLLIPVAILLVMFRIIDYHMVSLLVNIILILVTFECPNKVKLLSH